MISHPAEAMNKLQACPFTPRAKENADPSPLNRECGWGSQQSAPAFHGYYPAHSHLSACRLKPGPRTATTSNHSAWYEARLKRASEQTGLASETFPVFHGRDLGQKTPAEMINTPLSQSHEREGCPEAKC